MAETHLYTIKVARDEDLAEQIGKDIYFDLVDHKKVRSFHVQKDMPFNVFKEYVAKEFGIPARFQRFWLWAKRQNDTFRPSRPLTNIEEAQSLAELVMKTYKAEYHLFLQVDRGLDLCPIAPLIMKKDDILLFFKLYDPEKEELRYVGRLFVNCTGEPLEILTKLNKLAGYDSDEEIELYEEIKFEPDVMCEPVYMKLTFQESELKNGDIICFQKASAMNNVKLIRFPDVPSYLKYVRSRKVPFSSSYKESKDEESSEDQIKNIIDSKEIEAMIDEDAIGAIDRVLSEGISASLQSMHYIQVSRKSLKVHELRDIVFKEDLFEKFKNSLTPKVIFDAIKEKIDANAYALSSRQLEQVSAVVNLLNNIVRMFEKLENLKKEQDSAKKSTDQNNEVLKVKRQKILASNTSFTNQQTQLNSLDAQTGDLKAKIVEKDNMKSLNKEVKSIFHRLADDYIKLKSVDDKILEARIDLESHEKLYQFFRANPPF
ncbi:ubiquitin carboxyl-terminal hydrolase [Trifolium repens]|nr:ubiquitin carboxyl-terminal hydrolase [Trifolium repens]